MKSISFLLISILAVCGINNAFACWDPSYHPSEYYMYRVFNPDGDEDLSFISDYSNAKKNCALWQSLTSKGIPTKDIYYVVYDMPLDELEKVYDNRNKRYDNKFIQWITKKDSDILDFLLLAKSNEHIRLIYSSRWYYPTMETGTRMTLEEITDKAISAKSPRLRDRYLLQAVRALTSQGRYQECIDLWEKEAKKLPNDNLMRRLIFPYIAGALFHTGHTQEAAEYFAHIGDTGSILYCTGRVGKKVSTAEALSLVCEYSPNSPYIVKTLQYCIRGMEPDGSDYYWERDTTKNYTTDPEYNKLLALSIKMGQNPKSNNPAMWYYTAAFLSDLNNNTTKAEYYLKLAEDAKSSRFIDESIRIMRIYLDAKTSACNTAYENRLFNQLKWLDRKIRNNIDESVRQKVASGYDISLSRSFYYWNDMLRRITLSEVCPRMIKAGKKVRALQLANMADNLMFNLVNKRSKWDPELEDYKYIPLRVWRYSSRFNHFDYRNYFFEMIDSIGVDTAIEYVKAVNNPQSDFDLFLNKRGYTGRDYLYDIIGTQCLRNMRYGEAEVYLRNVSKAYKKHLNTDMYYNPFSIKRQRIKSAPDFKYLFAKEMNFLERNIKSTSNPNKKARLMARYATGIRNSFGRCWALTQYSRSGFDFYLKDDIECRKNAMKKSEEMFGLACEIVTDDETGADIQYMLCNFATVAKNYPNSDKGMLVRGHCDKLIDYHAETGSW